MVMISNVNKTTLLILDSSNFQNVLHRTIQKLISVSGGKQKRERRVSEVTCLEILFK